MFVKKVFENKIYKTILISLTIILGIIIFNYSLPYIPGVLGAATLYVMLKGQMVWFTEKKNINKNIGAFIIIIESTLFILIPVAGITILTIDTISAINIDPNELKNHILEFSNLIRDRFHIELFTPENLSFIPKASTSIIQIVGSNAYSVLINFLIILFLLYYMLYDYKNFETFLKEILPFTKHNKAILAKETKAIIKANAIGIPLLAIIQGIFAYIGYVIFNVSDPLLYAVITALATVVPILGTTIVWVPLSISLMITGETSYGIGLMIYGTCIIVGVDNIARLLIQKALADIHPLITIFGVLIGLPLFGFWGVIFGPLILSIFMLFINMYRFEYVAGSKAEPTITNSLNKKEK